MCYNVKYLTQKKLKYAKRRGENFDEISKIESDLNTLTQNMKSQFCASGFTNPKLLAFSQHSPHKPELINWGLIPNWVKSKKQALEIKNKTLNARIESVFEKPSFKKPIENNRCIIIIDGFYEHHFFNKKKYPYYIYYQNDAPISLGGIYDEWYNSDGEKIKTVSIVTTKGLGVMRQIHNNPKLIEPRMPLMLSEDSEKIWLKETINKADLQTTIEMQNLNIIKAHTVNPINSKSIIGNTKSASEERIYKELNQRRLF